MSAITAITATPAPVETANQRELVTQAREFESIFVRELLKGARIGGAGNNKDFGAMIVESLAGVIAEGGGVGLASRVQDMLAEHRRPPNT